MNDFEKSLTTYVMSATEKINKIKAEDFLVFPLFTDSHTDDIDNVNMNKLIPSLKLIT